MKILAIETSADETGIALLDIQEKGEEAKFKILGNAISSQIALHTTYGGIFPMMAKREHQKNIIPIFLSVLEQGKIYKKEKKQRVDTKLDKKINEVLIREQDLLQTWNTTLPFIKKIEIDAITVTTGPGLEPALWVGINFAQALGAYWDIPVIPVNHMEGHILSVFPNGAKSFKVSAKKEMFPMLSLLVSGGHTELVLVKDWMKYKKIGQTRDDAAGEAFDKVARMLGLPYPGGPEIGRLAEAQRNSGKINDITLPRPMIHSKDYDFSFSGLKTAVLYYLRDLEKNKIEITDEVKSKIAREFEDAAIEVLVKKTIRAAKEYNIKTLIVGGGVSASTYLQQELRDAVENVDKKIKVYFPAKGLSTDNAIMIGIAGYFQYKKKKTHKKLKADGNLSL